MRNQPEPQRSESKKPAWFELLDGDAPSAQVTKVSKKLPFIAALVTGGIIASGALFAGASAENSTGQSAVASIDQSTASTSAPSAQSTTSNSPSVANPAGGMQAPGANGGDDDYEDDDEDGEDDDRHERGEGRDRDRDHDDDE